MDVRYVGFFYHALLGMEDKAQIEIQRYGPLTIHSFPLDQYLTLLRPYLRKPSPSHTLDWKHIRPSDSSGKVCSKHRSPNDSKAYLLISAHTAASRFSGSVVLEQDSAGVSEWAFLNRPSPSCLILTNYTSYSPISIVPLQHHPVVQPNTYVDTSRLAHSPRKARYANPTIHLSAPLARM